MYLWGIQCFCQMCSPIQQNTEINSLISLALCKVCAARQRSLAVILKTKLSELSFFYKFGWVFYKFTENGEFLNGWSLPLRDKNRDAWGGFKKMIFPPSRVWRRLFGAKHQLLLRGPKRVQMGPKGCQMVKNILVWPSGLYWTTLECWQTIHIWPFLGHPQSWTVDPKIKTLQDLQKLPVTRYLEVELMSISTVMSWKLEVYTSKSEV